MLQQMLDLLAGVYHVQGELRDRSEHIDFRFVAERVAAHPVDERLGARLALATTDVRELLARPPVGEFP